MATKPTKAVSNPKDLRPQTDAKTLSKPIYNAADYRANWGETPAAARGKGSGKGKAAAKNAKIFHYSRRIAPGGHDPWGGKGMSAGR